MSQWLNTPVIKCIYHLWRFYTSIYNAFICIKTYEVDDIFGHALADHYKGSIRNKLWIYNKYGPREQMPLNVYFRTESDMPALERCAIEQCYGKILDAGAGAGSHALIMQKKGYEVTALDISGGAVEIMKDRGVLRTVKEDIFLYSQDKFDTIFLMMNGIGLTGTIRRLSIFLYQLKGILNNGGQLLFDSSDIAYLYGYKFPEQDVYYGEILYQYAYKGKRTGWFNWLYIDQRLLSVIAWEQGWKTEVLYEDGNDQYLARLTVAIK